MLLFDWQNFSYGLYIESMAKHEFTNRLIDEKSPYLLQHAHNPVDWYPWCQEAFDVAKEQDKPIFLSIGYATCHWCHVMERESFSNVHVAELLNEAFINIKVDREELPEVDSLYMDFAQTMMAGVAGWPLNVVLTPELKPFFAATYLPPDSKAGLLSVPELVEKIQNLWNSDERESVLEQSSKIVEIYENSQLLEDEQEIDQFPPIELIEDGVELLFQLADPTYGGLKGSPKFPIGYHINFMIAFSIQNNDGRALFLAEKTLDMMHRGGIYDHIGGGFSRYSTDEFWLIPHFEKMLYDNAILALSYCRGWQSMQLESFSDVCQETLTYIQRKMTHENGGFMSAEDSEVDSNEGAYYLWSIDEIKSALTKKEAELFISYYNITPMGNFHGMNVLNTPLSIKEFAKRVGKSQADIKPLINSAKEKLLTLRSKRKRPFLDDKVLTGWNGLMIHSMANGGAAFNRRDFLDAALKAAKFIKTNLWSENTLKRLWRNTPSDINGSLNDYANMIRASLTLFEVDCGTEWLAFAMELSNTLTEKFRDDETGAFFQTDGSDQNLLVRKKNFSDTAEPSGNAIHCENLLRLYQVTAHNEYKVQAEDILKAAYPYIETYPPGYIYSINNLLRFYDKKAPTIMIALNENEEGKEEIFRMIHKKYLPHRAIVWRREKEDFLFENIPFVKERKPIDGKTTVYLCYEGVCQEPLNDLGKIEEALNLR